MHDGMRTRLARRAVLTVGAALLAGCSASGALDGPAPLDEPIFGEDQGWDGPEEADLARLEFDGIIDGVRVGNDRETLAMNDQLNQASQDYAAVLAQTPGQLSHVGPDGSGPGDRAAAAGYDYEFVAENLAYGYTSNQDVVDAWMDSPTHRETILIPEAEDFGLGREDVTWVMMVGRRN